MESTFGLLQLHKTRKVVFIIDIKYVLNQSYICANKMIFNVGQLI